MCVYVCVCVYHIIYIIDIFRYIPIYFIYVCEKKHLSIQIIKQFLYFNKKQTNNPMEKKW